MTIYLLRCRQCSGTRQQCPICHGLNVQFEFTTQWGGGTVFEINQLMKFFDNKLWKLYYVGKTFEDANKPDNILKEIELE